MFSYSDPQPNLARAFHIKQIMDGRLISSFLYLLDCAESVLRETYLPTRKFLNTLNANIESGQGTLRGTLYAIHTQLVLAMKNSNVGIVNGLLHYLAESNPYIPRQPRINPLGSDSFTRVETEAFLTTVSTDYNSAYSLKFDATAPSTDEASEMKEIIKSVLQIIKNEDPETSGEIEAYVSDFVSIKSTHINAGTCFKAFGLVYLTILRDNQEWTTYLENIVHEAAHHHLFALWTIDPIIESDGNKMYKSPIRTEPRPLSGIYHAMFVLARTIRVLRIFDSKPEYIQVIRRMSTGYNQAKNTESLEVKFANAYTTVLENAKLTTLGQELLENCQKMVTSQ